MTVWPRPLEGLVESSLDASAQGPLAFPRMSAASTAVRALSHAAGEWLPPGGLSLLTTGAKRLRRLAFGARIRTGPEAGAARLRPGARPWNGKRAAVLLTHDLDTPRCLSELPAVLASEESRGHRSVVLPLTGAAYRIDAAFVAGLRGRGHEIGLHGLTHDYALGGRSMPAIERHLDEALPAFGPVRPRFYRAPAFCISARLGAALVKRGFRFDLSRTQGHPRYPSTQTLVPFHPPGFGPDLLELPLSLEDSWLFRDWRLSVPQALSYAARVLERAIEEGGLVVIDTHPSILADHPGFHQGFLDAVAENSADLWTPRPLELAAFLDPSCAA